MKFLITFIFVILFFINKSEAQQVNIVVTIPYLQDLIENITCENNDYKINSLLSSGVDPHTFILTPSDRVLLNNANLIIQIGAGLERFLDKIKVNSGQTKMVLSQHLNLRKMQKTNEKNSDFIYDPHIWQSPQLTINAAEQLTQIFVRLFPANKKNLTACSQNYIHKIQTTVKELKQQLAPLPENKKIIATNHDSLGYFAETFGFKLYSILGLSDEEEPTLFQLKNLITILQAQQIKAVFLETTGNSKNIQTVAQNAKVKIGGKLYGDSLGEKGTPANTTIGMWKANVSTIVKALE